MARKEEMIKSNVSCYSNGPVQWRGGLELRQYLAGVYIPPGRSNKPHSIQFNSDGSLKYVELKIMNLRPPSEAFSGNRWEEIGVWNSETSSKVDIKDIVWPGEALKPPEGVPERGFLSITFLEVRIQCGAVLKSGIQFLLKQITKKNIRIMLKRIGIHFRLKETNIKN